MKFASHTALAAALGCGLFASAQAAELDALYGTATLEPLSVVDTPLHRTLGLAASEAQELFATVAATPDGQVERRAPSRRQLGEFMRLLRAERQEMFGLAEVTPARAKVEHGQHPDARHRAAGSTPEDLDLLHENLLGVESVIGQDTRQQVLNTGDYPFRIVGSITDGSFGCTGTLIGPRHVLTAGHCVYDIDTDQWAQNLEFTPGQEGLTRPFGTVRVRTALALEGWVTHHRRDFDIAMLILEQDIGEQVGWMGFATAEFQPGFEVIINGYPGDKPEGTMWYAACPLQIAQLARLYYGCDTFGGMSGSAVHAVVDQDLVVYGVHAYGVDGTGLNSATRINQALFEVLLAWKDGN